RIKHFSSQAQKPGRKGREDAVMPAFHFVGFDDKSLMAKVKFAKADLIFRGAESQFEAAQTLVPQGGASQMQLLKSFRGKALHDRPHHHVVAPPFLFALVRGAKFVKGPFSKPEKDEGCNRTPLAQRHADGPLSGGEQAFADLF